MKQVKCDRLRRLAERKKAGHADALLRWNQQAIPVAVLTLLDERDALERRVAELEGRTKTPIADDVLIYDRFGTRILP